jgi:hypothetical protein
MTWSPWSGRRSLRVVEAQRRKHGFLMAQGRPTPAAPDTPQNVGASDAQRRSILRRIQAHRAQASAPGVRSPAMVAASAASRLRSHQASRFRIAVTRCTAAGRRSARRPPLARPARWRQCAVSARTVSPDPPAISARAAPGASSTKSQSERAAAPVALFQDGHRPRNPGAGRPRRPAGLPVGVVAEEGHSRRLRGRRWRVRWRPAGFFGQFGHPCAAPARPNNRASAVTWAGQIVMIHSIS